MESKKSYYSQQQKNMLVDLIKEDSDILSGKFSAQFTYKDAQKRWEIISNKLNAIPGTLKNWKQWRKTWQDVRSKVKSKKAKFNQYTASTGGGPPPTDILTDCEEKILSVINSYSIVGNETVAETSIMDFDLSETEEKSAEGKSDDNETSNSVILNTSTGVKAEKIIKKKKRTVAARRLMSSANATTALTEISKRKVEIKEAYYAKKINLLERQVTALEKLVDAFIKK